MNKPIKICSWNVNSLKIRLEQVQNLLIEEDIDILSLQETKTVDEDFPKSVFTEMGYHVCYSGQKTYNGVAIISKQALTEVETNIPNYEDPQKRIITATVNDLRIINLYVPNGSNVDSDKYLYKLEWLKNITKYLQEQLIKHPNLVVLGDFNIAPEDRDVHDIKDWEGCVLVSYLERLALNQIMGLNLHDSFRKFKQEDNQFSWWDYRAASFRRNRGLRIDLILLSDSLMQRCSQSNIAIKYRKNERPSDHAPVIVTLE